MKGKHLISITSRRAEYRLELERKISVIKGNSGTGKSSVIRLISDYLELGKDSGIKLTISSSASVLVLTNSSDWEKILPSVGNTILFFDEADSLFSKRTQVSSSNDKHANAETSYLLQKIEEYTGVSILATNNLQNFDVAFKRRMTYLIPIGMPDEATRTKMWEAAFPESAPLDGNVDFTILGRAVEITGSNIKNAAVAAAYLAAAQDREITMEDIIEAVDLECLKVGKMSVRSDIQAAIAGRNK